MTLHPLWLKKIIINKQKNKIKTTLVSTIVTNVLNLVY